MVKNYFTERLLFNDSYNFKEISHQGNNEKNHRRNNNKRCYECF